MQIPRKDRHLSEAIEVLDDHLLKYNNDVKSAYHGLTSGLQDFIDDEIEKCFDLRYYLENYHVINTESEGLKTMYPFWDSQEIFFQEIYIPVSAGLAVRVIVCKARQLGESTISQGCTFWKTIFTEGCNTLVLAQDANQADYLFNMSRLAYESLPWWMRPERRYEAKGRYLIFDRKNPDERAIMPGLRSQIIVDSANKISGIAGVGKTLRAAHISEISSFEDPRVLTQGIFPTMNAPDVMIIVESTARGRRNFFFEFWKEAIEGNLDWKPVFIPGYTVKKYFIPVTAEEQFKLTDEEVKIKVKVKEEANKDIPDGHFKWRRMKISEIMALEGDDSSFFQEFPTTSWHEAFTASGLCAFNKRRLHQIMLTDCRKPTAIGEVSLSDDNKTPKVTLQKLEKGERIPAREGYGSRLHVWEMPEEGETYYIGVDVGWGIKGRDFSAAEVFRVGHLNQPDVQVAEWKGYISPGPWASVAAALGYWYNEAQLAVECNDVGNRTDAELFRVLEYPNLFRWKHYDKIKNFITDFLGWYTNSKTRPMIISKMKEVLDDFTLILRSEELVDQMLDFAAEDEGSRFEGQEGTDDLVMAAQICEWCLHDSDWGKQAAGSAPPGREAKDAKMVKDFYNTDHSPLHDPPKASSNQGQYFLGGSPSEIVKPDGAEEESTMWEEVEAASTGGSNDWQNY